MTPDRDLARGRLASVFRDAGLCVPFVPEAMRSQLVELDDWLFATRSIDAMQMYFLDQYVSEAIEGNTADYVAVSHAGHGINSYAITYQLVLGPLALFGQAHWGGAYQETADATAAARHMLVGCAALGAVAERLEPGARRLLVVVDTSGSKSICRWLDPEHDVEDPDKWMHSTPRCSDPVLEAVGQLQETFAGGSR